MVQYVIIIYYYYYYSQYSIVLHRRSFLHSLPVEYFNKVNNLNYKPDSYYIYVLLDSKNLKGARLRIFAVETPEGANITILQKHRFLKKI